MIAIKNTFSFKTETGKIEQYLGEHMRLVFTHFNISIKADLLHNISINRNVIIRVDTHAETTSWHRVGPDRAYLSSQWNAMLDLG